MADPASPHDWDAYYDATADRPPRRTLLSALAGFAPGGERFAVDLGSGDGRDAIPLLRRGWSVLAIDAEPRAIERLIARAGPALTGRLATECRRFEDGAWPAADLVNASFALPLCPPERFPALWTRLRASLKPGGSFAGQLYGDRDQWAGRPGTSHFTRDQALALLDGLAVELFEEEEADSVTPRGRPKHWHIYHIVARR
jgi:SAM-dependent methyltransferase